MSIADALRDYGHAVFPYWWVVLTGVFMPFIDLLKWHGRELRLSTSVRIGASVLVIFVAQFLAYRDALRNSGAIVQEKAEAIGS